MTHFDEKPDEATAAVPEGAKAMLPRPAPKKQRKPTRAKVRMRASASGAVPGRPTKLSAGAFCRAPKGQRSPAPDTQPELSGEGPPRHARKVQARTATTGQPHSDAEGLGLCAHTSHAVDAPASLAEIRAWHRRRCFAMEQRKRVDLALGSFLRTQLGWRRDLDKDESDIIKSLAGNLIACGEKIAKGKPCEPPAEYLIWGDIIQASLASRRPWDDIESDACKEMERLAVELPVWQQFGEAIRGFGAKSLAVIIGEAGDLSLYSTHSKLWKRMGLAVMDGTRQGGLAKNAAKEDWIEHGYNRERRSRMWNIGDTLIKGNADGPYRTAYLSRKQYERERAEANGLIVAPAAKIPAKRQHEYMSDGHIHRRAQRYMEKRLLRDLWKAWKRAGSVLAEKPRSEAPASEIREAA